MVDRKDFLALNFYKKSPFFGSEKNMHYKVERIQAGEEDNPVYKFKVTYWPGPYNLASTDDALKQFAEFDFSEEGINQVADFLNERYENQKELWESVVIY